MLEEIVKLITLYTTVEHPYKVGMKDWMDNVKIHRHLGYNEANEVEVQYWVQSPYGGFKTFLDAKEAATAFCSLAYSKYNLANAFQGLIKRKLVNSDLEDVSDEEVLRLVELYQNEYHAQDFPFADQFSDELIKQEMQWSKEGQGQNFVEDDGPRFEN